jgi:hypothetical protein
MLIEADQHQSWPLFQQPASCFSGRTAKGGKQERLLKLLPALLPVVAGEEKLFPRPMCYARLLRDDGLKRRKDRAGKTQAIMEK